MVAPDTMMIATGNCLRRVQATTCPMCGTLFAVSKMRQRCCSDRCTIAWRRRRERTARRRRVRSKAW